MLKELEYPFDAEYILKKRRALKKQLIAEANFHISKKIAVLGGSTTHDIKDMLELFLMNQGIECSFFESEYNQFFEDVMFENPELMEFKPDIIFFHTSSRNIVTYPLVSDSKETVDEMLKAECDKYDRLWEKAAATFSCPIIQNNFELPFYRVLGNLDFADVHGRTNYLTRLNAHIAEYANNHANFFVNDLNYMAASYGLARWHDPFAWHMYKYACAVEAIPELSYNVSNIIKSIYGRNKKALVLDLDNTLWGGVVGDDGPDNIEIGQETSVGQLYSEFQQYLKEQKDIGVMLTVNSKNDEENALAGLNRPDSVLKPDDFVVIKANWDSKDNNTAAIASDLNIGTDALVFVDDNPAERHMVKSQLPEVQVPELGEPETYVRYIDRSGFFEPMSLSADDLKRNEMYFANAKRKQEEASFKDYGEYLKSLEMQGEIKAFAPMYMSRIAQLTNKSNQFNLTTVRCTQAEIEAFAANPSYITLYGKLVDKFGDNGVVSVVYGHVDETDAKKFHIDLWLMSCRVLKRGMEDAMLDELVRLCRERGIEEIYGYYYPTAKNAMVRELYPTFGFSNVSSDEAGNTVWKLDHLSAYENRNLAILVNA